MSATRNRQQLAENRLLAALPQDDRQRLLAHAQMVQLTRKQIVTLRGSMNAAVYFPISAVVSLVSVMKNGVCTDVGMVGKEGMVGLPAFLGAQSEPFEMTVEVAGSAHRMPALHLADEVHRSVSLEHLLLRYTQAFLNQVAQRTACRAHHAVKQRLATLLLMIGDGLDSDRFQMTHELLGQMLGVGRPSASLAAASVRADGLIGYRRGIVTILELTGLEAAACECYGVIRNEYARLVG